MERLFSLDAQLIYDAILLAIAILVMFTFLSYLLFNPARDFLKKRQERVKQDIDQAAADKEEARKLREDYESRIQNIQAEADEILSAARKKALENETRIVDEAKEEAARILSRARNQAELEKKAAAEDMKKAMSVVASAMAGKLVGNAVTAEVSDALLEDTLKEIGEETWRS